MTLFWLEWRSHMRIIASGREPRMSWSPVEEASDLTRCSIGNMPQTIPRDVVQGMCRRVASEQDRLYYIQGEEWGEAPSDNAERASAQTIPRDVVQGICRRMASEQDRLYYIQGEEWKKDAVWPPNG